MDQTLFRVCVPWLVRWDKLFQFLGPVLPHATGPDRGQDLVGTQKHTWINGHRPA